MWNSRSEPPSPPNEVSRVKQSHHKAVLSMTASAEAPECFQSRYRPSPQRPVSRKLRAKFEYQDFKEAEFDMSSVRPRYYFDILRGKNSGLKYRLPYYKAFYESAAKGNFGIRQGMCAKQAHSRRRVILRDESQFLAKLRRSASYNSKHTSVTVPKNSFETSVFYTMSDSYGKLPGITTLRLRKSREPSRARLDDESFRLMQEINEFDRKARLLRPLKTLPRPP